MPLCIPVSRKGLMAAMAALAIAVPATTANAIGGLGDIVHDPTSYVQMVKQVEAWQAQYDQMTQSLEKAEATLQQVRSQVDAVTGIRGLGDLLNNPLLQTLVPADLSATLSDLNASGLLSGEALTLRTASQVYDCGDSSNAEARVMCQAILNQNAQARAFQLDTLTLLNQRTTQIDALRAEINTTQDAKAIAELQARLQVEQAQVANDHNKIAIANAMLMSNAHAAAQAEQERVNALMATNKPSALNGFAFSALGYARSAETTESDE